MINEKWAMRIEKWNDAQPLVWELVFQGATSKAADSLPNKSKMKLKSAKGY
jgi:hypothetical protein